MSINSTSKVIKCLTGLTMLFGASAMSVSDAEACKVTVYKDPARPFTGMATGKKSYLWQEYPWTTARKAGERKDIVYNKKVYNVGTTTAGAYKACGQVAQQMLKDTSALWAEWHLNKCVVGSAVPAAERPRKAKEMAQYCDRPNYIGKVPPGRRPGS